MKSDAALVRSALGGRSDAYAEIVQRWTRRILGLCHALVRQRGVAEELTQETFVRGWIALATLRDPERLAPWLRGIARRVCFDWIATRRRPLVLFSQLGDDWSPDARIAGAAPEVDMIEREEESCRLLEEIDKLPEDYRIVVMLHYYGHHSYAELAELLDVSTATINMRLTKGRAVLRRRLGAIRRSP